MLNVCVSDVSLSMELDTGSDTTFVTQDQWENLGRPKLKRLKSTFKTFTDEEFRAKGEFTSTVKYHGQSHELVIAVSDTYSILGRDFLNKFQVD